MLEQRCPCVCGERRPDDIHTQPQHRLHLERKLHRDGSREPRSRTRTAHPPPWPADATITFSTVEVCGDPKTPIYTIQGNGLQSSLTGAAVSIEGVVTASYQGTGQFGGYFVQEEDAQRRRGPRDL